MPVSEPSYADLKRENESLGRRLRDAEGQAALFRCAFTRRDAEVARLREALRQIKPLTDPDLEPFAGGGLRQQVLAMRDRASAAWVIAAEALNAS